MNISSIVYKEIDSYKTSTWTVNGVPYSQCNTIDRISKYINSQFIGCDDPNAFFWNISNSRRILFAKSIDMDTKDFQMFGIGKTNYFQSWVLNALFKNWARNNGFTMTLDETTEATASYGSSVWKKSKENNKTVLKECSLKNLYFCPVVKNIIDTPVVELHYLTEGQIRKKYPEQAKDILMAADKAKGDDQKEVDSYEIWERWGEYEEDDNFTYRHFIGAGKGEEEVIILDETISTDSEGKPTDFPYYDFHLGRFEGRWLRIGVVERLFVLQERANTLVNQNAIITELASLPLFITSDSETSGNVLMSAVPGQVVTSSDLRQMPINNLVFNQFIAELEKIERQADELCFINESISGETPPSGVPFRSLAVSSNAAKSTFKYIKASIGEKMAMVLKKEIIPEFIKTFKKENIIDIKEVDADIRMFDDILLSAERDKRNKEKIKAGVAYTLEDDEALKKDIAETVKREGRKIKLEPDFFNLEWGIEMNATGDVVDKNTMNASIDSAIQDMIAAPAVVNTPIYQQKLENNGIPPFRLSVEEQMAIAGSTSSVPPAQTPDKLSQMINE